MDEDTLPVIILGHFLVGVSLTLKVIYNYGMAKKLAMATETLNYALELNHVIVPHSKYIRQRITKFQDQSVRQWLEELCNAFSGDDSQRAYQGDARMDVKVGAGIGIHSFGLTYMENKSVDEYYQYMLAELKIH
jgi:hypothetical protein